MSDHAALQWGCDSSSRRLITWEVHRCVFMDLPSQDLWTRVRSDAASWKPVHVTLTYDFPHDQGLYL